MKIRFKDQVVEVKNHPIDKTLYCLNDLHGLYDGGTGTHNAKLKPSVFLRNKKNKECKFSRLTLMRGTRQVIETYVDQEVIYKYAAWVDDDFYKAVIRLLRAGLDYQTIALALGVETNKNKNLIRIV